MNLLKYALIRLAVFFVVWGACMLLGLGWIFSTLVAAVVALAVGYLFFNTLRVGAGQDMANAWAGRPGQRGSTEQSDMDVEDAYTEGRYPDPGASGSSASTDPSASSQPPVRPPRGGQPGEQEGPERR